MTNGKNIKVGDTVEYWKDMDVLRHRGFVTGINLTQLTIRPLDWKLSPTYIFRHTWEVIKIEETQ